MITFYGVLWLEGANDVIADHFDVPLYLTTWIARCAIIRRARGSPTSSPSGSASACSARTCTCWSTAWRPGIIRQLPSGEFIEETRPVSEEARAVLTSRPEPLSRPPAESDVPAPGMRGAVGRVRERLYNVVTESVPMTEGNGHGGHGNGHGNGHAGAEPATVPASEARELGQDGPGQGGQGQGGQGQGGQGQADTGPASSATAADQGDGQPGS